MKERLHDTIDQRGRTSKILVLCGLGGAGKSQLTLSYIESYRDDYTAVFWIDAGAKIRLEADYKQIRNLLHSSKRTDIELDTCVVEVKQWCHHKRGRWLFVFDSADDIDDTQSAAYIDLRRVVVDTPSADVIITTRSQSAQDMTDLKAVQVAELTPAEARDLFLRRSKLPSSFRDVCEEVDAIAEELGFFALAINLAAAYVAETPRLRRHPGGYLDEYKWRRKTLLDRKPKAHVDQYGASVLATWETSYAAMLDRYPEACNLLMFLAYLSPDDLFLELLQAEDEVIIGGHAKWLLVEASSAPIQEVLDTSFEILRSYSLLLWRDEQSSHAMHKLVHAWSFERSNATSRAQFCKAALKFLASHGGLIIELPHRLPRMVPHMMMCFARACELYAQISDADKTGIVDSLGILTLFLRVSGKFSLAYEVSSFVHDHYRQNHCADQYQYYANVENLGGIMSTQGKYKEAIELLQPALAQCQEVHSPGYKYAVDIAQTLGRALGMSKKGAEAETVWRWALGACKAPHDILQISRSLVSYRDKSELAELSWQAFDSLEKLHGPTHPTTLFALLDYEEVLHGIGQYETSHALLKKALKSSNSVLGPEHQYTLRILRRHGYRTYLHGSFKESDGPLNQALSGLKKTAGIDHPETVSCMSDLAMCKEAQGLYDEAIEHHQNASDGYARTLGFDHPDVICRFSRVADLRLFLRERAAFHEAMKQVSSQFGECLQAGQHLRRPVSVRGRAFTHPGGSPGTMLRPNRGSQRDEIADSEDCE